MASATDEDTPRQSSISVKAKTEMQPEQAVVVLGEASESEEEEIMTDSISGPKHPHRLSLPISERSGHSPLGHGSTPTTPINYKSLLHKKLRERNVALRKRIVQAAQHPYHAAAKELSTISQQLAKSQSQIQEVGPVLRILTNDLCHLEDKLEITMMCASLIPDINMKVPAPMSL